MNNRVMAAVIPVRAGSRRIKNKNLSPFAGTTLLQHKIRQLRRVPEVDKIIVTSDSDEMLAIASREGAIVHKRASEYCDEKSRTFGEVVENVCMAVDAEDILWAPCTSPLVAEATYSKAIQMYYNDVPKAGDSLVAMEELKRFFWDSNGPINYKLGVGQVPSQLLPPLYVVTAGIHIASRENILKWKYVFGPNPVKMILDKRQAFDVDDGLDLACARAWLDFPEDDTSAHLLT